MKQATLVCGQADQTISGVTISTVATPWDEYRSNGLSSGVDGSDGWGYPGSRFPAVIGGNSSTLVHHTDSKLDAGNYHWDVSPDIVHAMAIGVADGLAVHEHDADYSRNPTIFAREQSGKQPYLLVELDDQDDPLPEPPTGLQVRHTDPAAGQLLLTPPVHGFTYEVLIQVVTLNRNGKRSNAAVIQSEIPEFAVCEKPQVNIAPIQASQLTDLSIIPVTDKYDQSDGPVGDLPENHRAHNTVFDGQSVRLVAAAGEVTGFQLLLRGRESFSIIVEMDQPTLRASGMILLKPSGPSSMAR